MSVPVETPFNSSTANGITTVFPYTFTLLLETDLIVQFDGVTQSSEFSVSGVGTPGGGNITFVSPPANGVVVLRKRTLPLSRSTDYQYQGDFLESTVDYDFDRIWQALQQLGQLIKTALKLPFDTTTDQIVTDNAASRVGKTISFDASGNMILAALATVGSVITSAFMSTVLVAANAAAALTTLGFSTFVQTLINSASAAAFRVLLLIGTKTTVASAASPDVWAAAGISTGTVIDMTGTTGVTGFAAAPQAGDSRMVRAASGFSITLGANVSSQGWNSGEVITLNAGDKFTVYAITTTTFEIILHQPVTGTVTASGIAFSFATVGNLSVAYSSRDVTYSRIGRVVHMRVDIGASTFTHTTASGVFKITGAIPFTPAKRVIVMSAIDGTWSITGAPEFQVKTDSTIEGEYVSTTTGTRSSITTANAPTASNKAVFMDFFYEAQ